MDEISYAKAGEAHIAYRVSGEPGAVDVVVVSGALFPFEILAEDRVAARFVDGFHSLGRVVVFDRRGVGLSDPLTDWSRSTQEQWADDLIAVIEAARLVRPVVVSWEFLGTARRAAATRPDLFGHLVLVNPAESTRPMRELMTPPTELAGPTVPTRAVEDLAFPSRREDPEFAAWMSRAGRSGASPAAASQMWAHLLSLEGSLTPTGIGVPTLVLHNRDCIASWAGIRAVAAAIPGSEIVQVNGIDVFPIAGDVDALVVETVQFVTGNSPALAPERAVAAVLFTDLVDSTRRAVDEGDRRWRDLLDVHDKVVQQCVAHQGGRVVKYTGDGVLALLPSATSALEAARSIGDELRRHGLEMRAGAHVGDVDVRGDDVSGIGVNVAARIMGRAATGETLVSESLRLAALGSGFRFDATRIAELKGVAEESTLHRWLP